MIFIFRNVAFRTIFSDIVNWCAKFVEHSCIEKGSLSSMGISPINLDWNLGVEIVFEDTVTLLTVQSTISKEFYPTRRWWATKNTIENIKSFNYTFSSPATVFYCRAQKKMVLSCAELFKVTTSRGNHDDFDLWRRTNCIAIELE